MGLDIHLYELEVMKVTQMKNLINQLHEKILRNYYRKTSSLPYNLIESVPLYLTEKFATENYKSSSHVLSNYYSLFECDNRIFNTSNFISDRNNTINRISDDKLMHIKSQLEAIFYTENKHKKSFIKMSDIDAVCSSKSMNAQYRNYITYSSFIDFGEHCYKRHLDKDDEKLSQLFTDYSEKPPFRFKNQNWCNRLVMINHDKSHRHAAMAYLSSRNHSTFSKPFLVEVEQEHFSQDSLNSFMRLGHCFTLTADINIHYKIQHFLCMHAVPYVSFKVIAREEIQEEVIAYLFLSENDFLEKTFNNNPAQHYLSTRNLEYIVECFKKLNKLGLIEDFSFTINNIINSFNKPTEN